MTEIDKEEARVVAKGLSDGEKQIMRRVENAPIRKSDWRFIAPNDAAFEAAHRKGLISYWPGDGDPFWTIDEPFGTTVRTILQEAGNGE
jgi:hypothetical protein